MHKHFYTVILFTAFFCLKGFSQAFPPEINSYGDTVGSNYLILYLNYNPHSNGPVKAEIQLQKGTGNNVYDSTFTLPASDSGYAELNLSPLTPCTSYQLLINMSNDSAQGLVINPLVSFTTLCASGITLLSETNFVLFAGTQSVEVRSNEMPTGAQIEIYDLTGKLLLNIPLAQPTQQIPFHQNAGMYLLRITGNGQSLYTNRFVVD
jgi:hypothetical protein